MQIMMMILESHNVYTGSNQHFQVDNTAKCDINLSPEFSES